MDGSEDSLGWLDTLGLVLDMMDGCEDTLGWLDMDGSEDTLGWLDTLGLLDMDGGDV